jgi:enediyne biosynthesis protein CalE2
MNLSELLSRKQIVLLDGAMGTELEKQGVDIGLPLWSANALLKAPQIVRRIHAEYLRAGADVVTTNTFRSNKRVLENTGLSNKWESLNRTAVELAFEARERYPIFRPVLIAGSLAPVEDCYSPDLVPSEQELLDEHSQQAEYIAQLGVDMLLAETIMTIREAEAVAKACDASGKEYAMSFFCKSPGVLLSGESLKDAITAIERYQPTALLVNCIAYQEIGSSLEILKKESSVPVGCYANMGNPLEEDADPDEHKLKEFAREAATWTHAGARIIGGCCGTRPDHIHMLARMLTLRSKNKI